MNLRNTTVRDLKKFLLIKFKDEDFLENLYEELDQIVEDKAQIPELTTDQLCNIIIENKLVEKLLNDETGGPIIKNQYNRMDDFEARQTHVLGYGRFDPQYQDARDCVKMRVILNQIDNLNTKIGNQSEGSGDHANEPIKFLQVFIAFMDERVQSETYYITEEIEIKESFILSFSGIFDMNSETILQYLKTQNSPMRFSIILIDKFGNKEIVSAKEVEWRYTLTHRSLNLKIDLPNQDLRSHNIGTLSACLQLESLDLPLDLLNDDDLEIQLQEEKTKLANSVLKFNKKFKTWWEDYKDVLPVVAVRTAKVYVKDCFGFLKPLNFFLQKIQSRAISSPEEAARFVSLIPYKPRPMEENSRYLDIYSFLTQGYGNSFAHATLLCSLLIGFKIDAYVVMGESSDGDHCWVLTRSSSVDQKIGKVRTEYKFWESLTGRVYVFGDAKIDYLYRKVDCVFGWDSLYANMQRSDMVYEMSFDLADRSKWKELKGIQAAVSNQLRCTIRESETDDQELFLQEEKLETDLMNLINDEHNRADMESLSIEELFDEALCHLLGPLATHYELAWSSGVKVSRESCSKPIKNYVPEGFILKVVPIQFKTTTNPKLIFQKMMDNEFCESIICSMEEKLKLGIRCKIVMYPEGFYSVWVVLAATYIGITFPEG